MISIIVIVHNTVAAGDVIMEYTRNCITSMYATATQPFELVLIDNGSGNQPATHAALTELVATDCSYKQKHTLILNENNESLSKCWNDVLAITTGEYVYLVNNDIRFLQPGWMEAVTTDLSQPQVGLVGLHGMSWYQFSFIEGSFLCFKQSLVAKLGTAGRLFDERFEFTCEDVDLCRRVTDAGLLIRQTVELASCLVHAHHVTFQYTDLEGGLLGRPVMTVAHTARVLLCQKYDLPEWIND